MTAGYSVAGGTGGYVAVAVVVAGGAEDSVVQSVDCPVVGGAESLVAEGAGHSATGSVECFGGTSLVDFADHHPSPLLCALLCFCKRCNVVPISIFLCPA